MCSIPTCPVNNVRAALTAKCTFFHLFFTGTLCNRKAAFFSLYAILPPLSCSCLNPQNMKYSGHSTYSTNDC